LAGPQEAAEAQDGIGHPSALFFDHHTLDRADLLTIGTVNGCTFDLVAANQAAGFTLFNGI
jgi:hypothetical protein